MNPLDRDTAFGAHLRRFPGKIISRYRRKNLLIGHLLLVVFLVNLKHLIDNLAFL